jgi:hypothetical protein
MTGHHGHHVNSRMQTFKQFLAENDPLNDVAIEMWLRHRFSLSKHEAQVLRDNLEAWDDLLMSTDLYDKLMAAYTDEIPYDVAKGRGNVDPDQWLVDKITGELSYAGLELE